MYCDVVVQCRYLALVCMMPADSFSKAGLVEYNFMCFKKAISQLFEAKLKSKLPTTSAAAANAAAAGLPTVSADAKDQKTAPVTSTAAGGTSAKPATASASTAAPIKPTAAVKIEAPHKSAKK